MDERDRTELRRDLGLVDLMSFGVGATIGSGIFVLVGVVAAVHTGPAVLISLMISGLCAMLSALSYAELSSMVPVSGASYVYVYISLGELAAWLTVWTLILEFLIGASTVSVGWSSYIVSIFYDAFKVKIPVSISSSPVKWDNSIQKFVKVQGAMFNLPATLIVTILTGIILLGSKQSARINTIITFVKLIVIVVFVFASIQYINRENYAPFVPEQKNGEFGVIGIFKGAQEMFFAYLGFDIISTSAQEARNPQRDMPIAIGVSLTVCVICYCVVSVILTGIAKYTELNTASPISAALAPHKNTRWLRIFVDIGILSGLTSVVLIMLMAQGRMFISVANDGLLPPLFRRINKWSRTPVYSQLIIGGVSAICAGLLPVDILGDLTSLAAILVFLIVHISVIVLRYKHPRAARGFTIPFGLAIPIFGIAISMVLIVLSGKQSIARISIWLGIGILVYLIYGRWHSKLNLIASDAEHKLQENSQSGAGLQKTDTSLAYLKTDELSSGTGSGRTSNIFETFSRGNGPLTKSQVRHPTQEIKVSSPIPI
ncbi:hypothetical protein H4219_003106 [Mycoemilia scoparia]|uniref:Amino acid transporter n=1 Tax=Mycoemilia scoparia TaxID=417184 RepID=A0A9W7ZVV1_9FUNG|nr:hypothetical protein H4219_003106 [Mycoemilia scoparia]